MESTQIIDEIIGSLEIKEGVILAADPVIDNEFEIEYISIREKENRIYPDDVVMQLPNGMNTMQVAEWKMREKSTHRVIDYFKQKQNLCYLDLGCGNGWFTALLSNISGAKVVGLDLNMNELKQATRIFKKSNLHFVYGDIFHWPKYDGLFDIITINAAIQYFPKINILLNRLFTSLKEGGEIHIIDSPFYTDLEVDAAKKRSRNYYSNMGFEKMSDNYFHHTFSSLDDFEFMYKPLKSNFFNKVFSKYEIPFPWIKINKERLIV